MKRFISVAVLSLLAVVMLNAQAPAGWKMRGDHSMNASDPDAPGSNKFVTKGSGFLATNPMAAIYWNPANTATGTYNLKGTFTFVKSTGYMEYFGLLFGGNGLDGAGQSYLYFEIDSDGGWLVKTRNGGATSQVASSGGPSSAVKKGAAANTLEVHVMPDKIDFVINGTVVSSAPKTGPAAKTDGIYGIRINHNLEVQVDGFGVTKG